MKRLKNRTNTEIINDISEETSFSVDAATAHTQQKDTTARVK